MIRMRHQQPNLWETFFGEEVADLWEPWMRGVDELLEDDAILNAVYEAQGRRHFQSRTRGRHQTPAEVVLRMLILKHVRNWSYETLEREVRANVVYRSFCRIGMEKVPDAKTLVRLGQQWDRKRSARCMIDSWPWRRSARSSADARCG
jgi:transposase, IS5 family